MKKKSSALLLTTIFLFQQSLFSVPFNGNARNITASGSVVSSGNVAAKNVRANRRTTASSVAITGGDITLKDRRNLRTAILARDGSLKTKNIRFNDSRRLTSITGKGTGALAARLLTIKNNVGVNQAKIASDGSIEVKGVNIKDAVGKDVVRMDGSTSQGTTNSLRTTTLKLGNSLQGNFEVPAGGDFSLEIKFRKASGSDGYPFRAVAGGYPEATFIKIFLIEADTGRFIESFYNIDATQVAAAENNQLLASALMAKTASVLGSSIPIKWLGEFNIRQTDIAKALTGAEIASAALELPLLFVPTIAGWFGTPVINTGRILLGVKAAADAAMFGAFVAQFVDLLSSLSSVVEGVTNETRGQALNIVGAADSLGASIAPVTGGTPLADGIDENAIKTNLVDAFNDIITTHGPGIKTFVNDVWVQTGQANRHLRSNHPNRLKETLDDIITTGTWQVGDAIILSNNAIESLNDYIDARDKLLDLTSTTSNYISVFSDAKDVINDVTFPGTLNAASDINDLLTSVKTFVPTALDLSRQVNATLTNFLDLIATASTAADVGHAAYREIMSGLDETKTATTTYASTPLDPGAANPGFFSDEFYDILVNPIDPNRNAAIIKVNTLRTAARIFYLNEVVKAWQSAENVEGYLTGLDPDPEDVADDIINGAKTLQQARVTAKGESQLVNTLNTIYGDIRGLPRIGSAAVTKDDAFGTVTVTFTPQGMNAPFKIFYEVTDKGVLRVSQV